jgi:hypothetical protein
MKRADSSDKVSSNPMPTMNMSSADSSKSTVIIVEDMLDAYLRNVDEKSELKTEIKHQYQLMLNSLRRRYFLSHFLLCWMFPSLDNPCLNYPPVDF